MPFFLTHVFFTIIDVLLLLLIFRKATGNRPASFFLFLIILVIILATPLIINNLGNETSGAFFNLVSSASLCIISGLLFGISLNGIIFWSCNFISISLLSESITVMFQDMVSMENAFSPDSYQYYFIGTLISCILKIIIVLLIVKLMFRIDYIELSVWPKKLELFFSIIPISSIGILCVIEFIWQIEAKLPTLGLLMINLGAAIITFFELYLFQKIQLAFIDSSHQQASEAIIEEKIKYLAEIENKEKKLKIMRHDLKNHFLILKGYIEDKRSDSAIEHINSSIRELDQTNTKFYTNNFILNYLLNQKANEASINNIQITIHALVPQIFRIDNNIVAALLGNLIDNAINACIRQKDFEKKIEIELKLSNNNFIINICNTFDMTESLTRRGRLKEGIGLKSVQNIVDTQNGLYKHWIEGNKYYASVILMNLYVKEEKKIE